MKRICGFLMCVLVVVFALPITHAQQPLFPVKPVRLVVPQGAGGSSDGLARIIAERLSEKWRQPVVVDNKPGAGGNIGAEFVAKALPDGHTILLGYLGTSAINGALYKNLNYSPEKDLVPAAPLATVPYVIVVNPALPAHSLQELAQLARTKRVTFASAGIGTVNHLLGEVFNSTAQVRMAHIPYKTAVAAMTSTISGETDVNVGTIAPMIQQARSGAIRPLAVLTSKRVDEFPDLPTAREAGYPQLEVNGWFAIFVPAGTPRTVVQRIHVDTLEALGQKAVQERIAGMGAEPLPMSLAAFEQLVAADIEKWGRLTRNSGATAD